MRIVLVGRAADRERLRRALRDGPSDIVGEVATLPEARALGAAADGLLLAAGGGDRRDDDIPAEALTAREAEVLQLLAEGLPNKTIATRLGISDQTVKFHVAAICAKLGAPNRTSAVRLALDRGLLTI